MGFKDFLEERYSIQIFVGFPSDMTYSSSVPLVKVTVFGHGHPSTLEAIQQYIQQQRQEYRALLSQQCLVQLSKVFSTSSFSANSVRDWRLWPVELPSASSIVAETASCATLNPYPSFFHFRCIQKCECQAYPRGDEFDKERDIHDWIYSWLKLVPTTVTSEKNDGYVYQNGRNSREFDRIVEGGEGGSSLWGWKSLLDMSTLLEERRQEAVSKDLQNRIKLLEFRLHEEVVEVMMKLWDRIRPSTSFQWAMIELWHRYLLIIRNRCGALSKQDREWAQESFSASSRSMMSTPTMSTTNTSISTSSTVTLSSPSSPSSPSLVSLSSMNRESLEDLLNHHLGEVQYLVGALWLITLKIQTSRSPFHASFPMKHWKRLLVCLFASNRFEKSLNFNASSLDKSRLHELRQEEDNWERDFVQSRQYVSKIERILVWERLLGESMEWSIGDLWLTKHWEEWSEASSASSITSSWSCLDKRNIPDCPELMLGYKKFVKRMYSMVLKDSLWVIRAFSKDYLLWNLWSLSILLQAMAKDSARVDRLERCQKAMEWIWKQQEDQRGNAVVCHSDAILQVWKLLLLPHWRPCLEALFEEEKEEMEEETVEGWMSQDYMKSGRGWSEWLLPTVSSEWLSTWTSAASTQIMQSMLTSIEENMLALCRSWETHFRQSSSCSESVMVDDRSSSPSPSGAVMTVDVDSNIYGHGKSKDYCINFKPTVSIWFELVRALHGVAGVCCRRSGWPVIDSQSLIATVSEVSDFSG